MFITDNMIYETFCSSTKISYTNFIIIYYEQNLIKFNEIM
jgi:hypothetical protein